jgi:hypothetical protein
MSNFRFLLHSNQFSERGDSVDLMSMSKNLYSKLGIESVIAFPEGQASSNPKRISEAVKLGHNIVEYKNRKQLEEIVLSEKLTHNYVFNDGTKENISYLTSDQPNPRLLDTLHLTRAVFRNYDPHGDFYLYVSEWLYDWSQRKSWLIKKSKNAATVISWLPHMVDVEIGDGDHFRRAFGIPLRAKLIGRIGGFDEFNDLAARQALIEALNTHPELYAVVVNTKVFAQHKKLIYISVLDRQGVWDFYSACDILLNGRRMGESFGFSIVEPLSVGKPVLAPSVTRNILMDRNHVRLLNPLGLLYSSRKELLRKIQNLLHEPIEESRLKSRVEEFKPDRVMATLDEIVLSKS